MGGGGRRRGGRQAAGGRRCFAGLVGRAAMRRTLKLIMVELKRMREWLDWMKPMPPMSAWSGSVLG